MNKFCIQIFRLSLAIFLGIIPIQGEAKDLTYQYQDQIFTIPPQAHWIEYEDALMYRGKEIVLPEEVALPKGVIIEKHKKWNRVKIMKTIEQRIVDVLNRETGSVTISRDEEGDVVFDGVGLPGRILDVELTADLTLKALEENIYTIQLPVTEIEPEVIVDDQWLRSKGIEELVSIGESDYSRSTLNRRHNIALGLSRFDGYLIEQGAETSFNEILGPVNGATGFLEELTILGDKTLPAYGGGLCQVSTTAYRGVWKAGFPITSRRNHSYAVRYYAPAGTDATIFPPWTDMRFVNNTDASILIQTYYADNQAYFLYYGTKPSDRTIELVGPFTWDVKAPPEDKVGYTTEIPIGETRVVGNRVPGMKTTWYRYVTDGDAETDKQEFYSEYSARPYYEEIGVAMLDDPDSSNIFFPKTENPEVIVIDENTTITIPRRGTKIRVRRAD
jgi:vancomycin resistance protein YoaR